MKMRSRMHPAAFVLTLILMVTQMASAFSGGGQAYPQGPNPRSTPGALCAQPDAYRYPEKIKYCNRNVESSLKNDIIQTYDRQYGHNIGNMQRSQFKIDHYIPLCAGGSNERENLWPQHQTVFTITDPLEALICEKMAAGRLKQSRAVEIIREAKSNLPKVADIISEVQSL